MSHFCALKALLVGSLDPEGTFALETTVSWENANNGNNDNNDDNNTIMRYINNDYHGKPESYKIPPSMYWLANLSQNSNSNTNTNSYYNNNNHGKYSEGPRTDLIGGLGLTIQIIVFGP